MKIFLLVALSLTAYAAAGSPSSTSGVYVQYLKQGGLQCRQNCRRVQNPLNDCDIVNCPPAVRDGCQEPDCSLPGNILRLHPHPDPNYFFQCRRTDDFGGAEAIVRPCACGTVFSARVDETRCVHPWEWKPDCPEHPPTWQNIILSEEQCRPDCETCDDCVGEDCVSPPVGTPEPLPTNTPGTPGTTPGTTTVGTPVTTPNNCQCPCMPCVWWPCMPCLPVCPCNNNRQQQQAPQMDWQQQQPSRNDQQHRPSNWYSVDTQEK